MQVLIVDDDLLALAFLKETVRRLGYTAVTATNGREALLRLQRGDIRLVITDWEMPEMDGLQLCQAIRREDLATYVYIIMLTGRTGDQYRMEGLCAGADDFLNKPLEIEELLVCLKSAERILSLETRDMALFALAKLAETREVEGTAHVERVQQYTRLLAKHLTVEFKTVNGLDDEAIRLLFQTCPLHDLGKVAIPDSILLKKGKLTPDEFAVMKTHTIVGAQTLDAALRRVPNARFLQVAREIAATHHEKYDGTGYPHGLIGAQIPISGRIVAVADVYDALTSRRIYRGPLSHESARQIIEADRGAHFDPDVVDAFVRAQAQFIEVARRLHDDVEQTVDHDIVLPSMQMPVSAKSPCRILLVEDDALILQRVREILAVTGEPILTATDGADALRLIETESVRMIISDWEMPVMDGLELCRRIRARAEGEFTHFIMLTAHSDKARLLDAYEVGVDDFVSKPFDTQEFLARVRAGIRAAKLHEEMFRKAVGSQAINAQLVTMNSRLEKLSMTDELTGLYNRRHAMARLQEQWGLAERYGGPLTIAMIDVDHFKQINDTHGHQAGDEILRRVAATLREQTRVTDVVCRVGGDEFLILFPSQTVQEAAVCAQRCRHAIESSRFGAAGQTIPVSLSIGLASRAPDLKNFIELVKAADEALYEVKRRGRGAIGASGGVSLPVATRTESPKVAESAPSSLLSAGQSPQMPIRAAAQSAPIDPKALLARCGGDPKFASMIAEKFKSTVGIEVAKISSGLAEGNIDAMRRAAHSLKSMAAYMAAQSVSHLAAEIETLARDNRPAEIQPLLAQLQVEVNRALEWIAKNPVAAAA